jgi:hypothetical protein
MLIVQVATYTGLTLSTCIIYLLVTLPTGVPLTPLFTAIDMSARFLYYFSFVVGFILFIISGRVYRQEFVRVVNKTLRLARPDNQIQPHAGTIASVPLHTLLNAPVTISHRSKYSIPMRHRFNQNI